MNAQVKLIGLVLVQTLLLTTSSFATLTTIHYNSDAERLAAMPDSSISFVAEGSTGLEGHYNLNLGPDMENPAATADYSNYSNNKDTPYAFTISYNATTQLVSFIVGSNTLNYHPTGTITDIFIRASVANQGSPTVTVNNLVYNGQSIADTARAENAHSNQVDILRVSGGDFSGNFTLTGSSTFSWNGNSPNRYQGFQVSFGQVAGGGEAVPEASSLTLLLLGSVLLHRRKRAQG